MSLDEARREAKKELGPSRRLAEPEFVTVENWCCLCGKDGYSVEKEPKRKLSNKKYNPKPYLPSPYAAKKISLGGVQSLYQSSAERKALVFAAKSKQIGGAWLQTCETADGLKILISDPFLGSIHFQRFVSSIRFLFSGSLGLSSS